MKSTFPYHIPPYTADDNPIVVSIKCLVYNHAPYLRQCFEGFVQQRTRFAFEVIINDDCSTDGSDAIIREYTARYPEIFRPIYHKENLYRKYGSFYYSDFLPRQAARGKYIAQCEGDDYWCDPMKLQRQVDYLEAHPQCGMVYAKAMVYDEKERLFRNIYWGGPQTDWKGLMRNNTIITCTTLYRAELEGTDYFKHIQNPWWNQTDLSLWLYIAMQSEIHFMDEIVGVRRMLSRSASHSNNWQHLKAFQDCQMQLKRTLCRYFDKPYLPEWDERNYHVLFQEAFQAREKKAAQEYYRKLLHPSRNERLKYLSLFFPLIYKKLHTALPQRAKERTKKQHNAPIDFVIYWVDGNDEVWRKKRAKYEPQGTTLSEARYRNWQLLRYWFRAVETYAPWVHRIFFVSDGQQPKWLNTLHPKLRIVDHKDFIPSHLLPTFNSHTIELNLHRIEGLSEQFVVFNDDTFLNAPIKPSYYFCKGLPCAATLESPIHGYAYTKEDQWGLSMIRLCNVELLNYHFNRRKTVKENWRNWLGTYLDQRYWCAAMIITLVCGRYFQHFQVRHNEKAFLRSICREVWEKEPQELEKSCTRFRQNAQVNNYFLLLWHLAMNKFHRSSNYKQQKSIAILPKNKTLIKKWLKAEGKKPITSLCLNDTPDIHQNDYEAMKLWLQKQMQEKLPFPSSYECYEKRSTLE